MPPLTVSKGTIKVTFAEPSTFVFDPVKLVLKKERDKYEVTFKLVSTTGGTKLVNEQFRPAGAPPNMQTEKIAEGLLVTFDKPSDTSVVSNFHYTVTVRLRDGSKVSSPDPEIEIPPGP
jgi:hypothetical protein